MAKFPQPAPCFDIFRADGKYTNGELQQLVDFMHADFPALIYPGDSRYGSTIIEYPPADVDESGLWATIINEVFLPERDEVHPLLRRRSVIARFVDSLHDKRLNINADASALRLPKANEHLIRINKYRHGQLNSAFKLARSLLHEYIEGDIWIKTLRNDKEFAKTRTREINTLRRSIEDYNRLPDEQLANQRALKALRRLWPEAKFSDPSYEEPIWQNS